jgi:hypothetical protein
MANDKEIMTIDEAPVISKVSVHKLVRQEKIPHKNILNKYGK